MNYYPLFANLNNRACLVVGAGSVAQRKIDQLLSAGAQVTVVAPHVCAGVERWQKSGDIELIRAEFRASHAAGRFLIIAATSCDTVNAAVEAAAAEHHTLCNVVDDGPRSTFILPAIIRRGPVAIAISTAGYAPVLARWIKSGIERWLPQRIDSLASFANTWRAQVRARLGTLAQRRRLWEQVFDGDIAQDVLSGRGAIAHRKMTERLASPDAAKAAGEAWLVGAGPGDAGLITLRGYELLRKADVVLYDRLVAPGLLKFARVEAVLIDVGKRAGQSHTQADINALLVRHVQAGKRVCRLKGGDAFVFGRGGEELAALKAHGLSYQVVPGVTAATACGAYAGIPLTDRHTAHGVVLTTAHFADDRQQPDWCAMARTGYTLAFYMGARRLHTIAHRLMDHGLPADTPYAVVENGATSEQRVLHGALGDIEALEHFQVEAPAMLFVGRATAVAGDHAWFAPDGFHVPALATPRVFAETG